MAHAFVPLSIHRMSPLSLTTTTTTAPSTTFLSMTLMPPVTIYGHSGSRSPLVNWACLEMNIPFTMADRTTSNPHPFQQLPCLTDTANGAPIVVFESGAILQYLVETRGPSTLTRAQRASILSWIVWANASLDPICYVNNERGQVIDTGLRRPNRRMDQLNALLQGDTAVLVPSVGFSTADVAVASYVLYGLLFFPQVDLASRWPHVARYVLQCASRPAYGQAFGRDMQANLVANLQAQLDRLPKSASPKDDDSNKKLFGMF
jgi:glutathione S-transferase